MKKVLLYLFVILQVVCIAQTPQLDSLKLALKKAKHDTTRCGILSALAESASEEEWPQFNEQLKFIAESNLKTNSISLKEHKIFKRHLASALNNIGYLYSSKGDIPKALENYDKSLKISEEIGDKEGIGILLNNIGSIYDIKGDNSKALEYHSKSLKIKEELGDKEGIATSLNNIGFIYNKKGDGPNALEYYGKSLKIQEAIGDKEGVSISLNNIGFIYSNQGDIAKALECYGKSMKIREEAGDKAGMATSLNNVGLIYEKQGDVSKALEYYGRSLKIEEAIGRKVGIATSLNNIGMVYYKQENTSKALEYFSNSLNVSHEIGDKYGIAMSLNNIGAVYNDEGDAANALEYHEKSLKIRKLIGDKYGISMSLNNIGVIYLKQNNYLKAIEYLTQSLKISNELGYPESIREASKQLHFSYKSINNYKLALENHELYIQMRDSLNNIETQKATIKQQTQYEYDKKKAIADKEHELQLNQQEERAASEKSKQNIIIASVSFVLVLMAVFSVFLYNRFKVTQKQKQIIEVKERETLQQKNIIEEKHREITDSINYAERIQRSFLATQSHLEGNLNASLRGVPIAIGTTKQSVDEIASPPAGVRNDDSNYFILFKPKDVVSGDFYWSATLNNGNFALATADSTGHGVPGAIMSLLNITSLEKAIETETSPDKILNLTRNIIIERLKKDGSIDGGKDGMDCSLIVFNENRTKLQIAAANNPVWIMRSSSLREVPAPKGIGTTKQSAVSNEEIASLPTYARNNVEVIEIKADKMPVGKHERQDTPFTLHEIDLQKGDVIYTLTDGFPDQFGGPMGKKFMSKKLKELLQSTCHKPLNEQQQILEQIFAEWVGDLEQVDDVTLIGIRV